MKLKKLSLAALLLSALAAGLIACGPGKSPGLLGSTIDAHGGYQRFFSYGGLEYDLKGFPFGAKPPYDDHQTIDLSNRKIHIQGDGYTIGWNGTDAWVENPTVFGVPARFYYNTPFYFFALPFAFGDPGVNIEARGSKEVGGKSYDVYYVSYGKDVGDTPDDDYIVYIDPETKVLSMASYIVTFPAFAQGKAPSDLPRNAVAYEWQTLDNGLTVASAATFHAYDEENVLGQKLATISYENVQFEAAQPDAALFEKTEAAVVDASL